MSYSTFLKMGLLCGLAFIFLTNLSAQSACNFLTTEEVMEIMDVTLDGEPQSEEVWGSDDYTQVSCTYAVENEDQDGLTIYYNYGERYGDSEKARKSFDQAITYLQKGVSATAEENGVEATFSYKGNFQSVPDIGDVAYWQPAKGKYISGYLMFIKGKHVIQIHPGLYGKENDEQSFELALELAEKMITRL